MIQKTITQDKIKEFILEFFNTSTIKKEKDILTITDVPLEFVKFIGKRPPYILVFDVDTHNRVKDSELIMQGSYFLLAIKDYLDDKGTTSLLKMDIKKDILELSKCPILKKYKILDFTCKNGFIYEFSFLSSFQYLNDKKQSITRLMIKDKDILEIDLSKFKVEKGNIEDINILDPFFPYEHIKKILDKKVEKEIIGIKTILKQKLDKELLRVKDHYFKQLKEKDEEVETCARKIKLLQNKLRHTTYERDINTINRTIKESKERLEMLKNKGYKERLRTEEMFHMTDEIEKHALSIKNVLMNITVYYYPIFDLLIKNKGKNNQLSYDPVLDKLIK